MTFTPLTQDQYQKALNAGFSPSQILTNEQRRKSESQAATPPTSFMGTLGNMAKGIGSFLGNVSGITGVAKGVGEAGKVAGGLITGHEYNPQTTSTQFAGSVGKVGLNTALAMGTGGTSIPAMAGIGAGLSAAQSLEEGKSPTLGGVATGAVVGGALPVAGKALDVLGNKIFEVLPQSLIKNYIPTGTKDISQYVLENKPLGTTKQMLTDSKNVVSDLGNKIEDILKSSTSPANQDTLQQVVDKFPNSAYTKESVAKAIKSLVPEQSKLVDKVLTGDANILEKNTLRSAVDQQVQSVYTKLSVPPAKKEIGATFAGMLRDEVKSVEPTTKPLFDEMSKNINIAKALGKAVQKSGKIGLRDLFSAMTGVTTGFTAGGPIGAAVGGAGALAGERVLGSPAVGVGMAKGLSKLGEVAIPQVAKNVAKIGILNNL